MRRLSIDGPHIGDWFAVAFISWTDPKIDRIEQQGKWEKSINYDRCCCSLTHIAGHGAGRGAHFCSDSVAADGHKSVGFGFDSIRNADSQQMAARRRRAEKDNQILWKHKYCGNAATQHTFERQPCRPHRRRLHYNNDNDRNFSIECRVFISNPFEHGKTNKNIRIVSKFWLVQPPMLLPRPPLRAALVVSRIFSRLHSFVLFFISFDCG